jgi:hypothetical protein
MKNKPCFSLFIVLVAVCFFGMAQSPPKVELWRSGKNTLYANIQSAINAAQPGDLIKIRAGTYYENIVLDHLQGKPGAHIRLEGAEGENVVLDGADQELQKKGNHRWKEMGNGEYQTTVSYVGPDDTWNRVTAATVGDQDSLLATYWFDTKFDSLQRGRGIQKKGNALRLKMPDGLHPSNLPIHIGTSEAILRIQNSAYVEIRNLQLKHAGFAGIYLVGTEFSHITLEHLQISSAFRGITTDEKNSGSDVLIKDCMVSNNMPRDWPWTGYDDGADASDDSKAPQRTTGIMIKGGKNMEIRNCEIAGWWDGMKLTGRAIKAHHNSIHNIQDDIVELESNYSEDVRFYNNVGYDAFVGISVINNAGGNVYVFRNRIVNARHEWNPKTRKQTYGYSIKMGRAWGNEKKAQNVKFFNNSFYAYRANFWDARSTSVENFEFVNNIFCTGHDARNFLNPDTVTHSFEKGCKWMNNVWNKQGQIHEPGLQNCDPSYVSVQYLDATKNLDLNIQPHSCAKDAGTDYPKRAWPGIDTCPSVGAPDIGAHEIGQNDDELAHIGPAQ